MYFFIVVTGTIISPCIPHGHDLLKFQHFILKQSTSAVHCLSHLLIGQRVSGDYVLDWC